MTITLLPPALVYTAPVILFLIFWALCYWPLAGFIYVMKAGAKKGATWFVGSRAGKWTIGHSGPIGSYAPLLAVLVLGGIATIGAGYLFEYLSRQLRLSTSTVYYVDQFMHAWFEHVRQPAATTLFSTATNLGGTIGMGAIVGVTVAILFARKERASAIFVIVTAGVGALLNLGLKWIFARARPDLTSAIAMARWYSFPSGHAMNSFITFGALAYIALRQPWSWISKSAVLALAITLAMVITVSRVYLGVHWTSDVVGGWSAGMVWLASAVTAFEM
jgi:membrane-associated phospholipid phosphatase